MKLIVGLGNPGSKYAGNRHNVGFMALDRIADHANLGSWRTRFHSLACDGELAGARVLLLKPQTYYNETGNAVREAAKFLKVKVADIIVFHDEIDLAPGKLRVKVGGGLAGNNGLRSMQAQLSSSEFTRVRIGVGHPGDKTRVANYVLKDFPKADKVWLEDMLDAIARSAPRLAAGENDRFQSDVAQAMSALRAPEHGVPAQPGAQSNSAARAAAADPQADPMAGPPRKPSSSPSASPRRATSKRASSTPSQLELARNASTQRHKQSRKIKKGVRSEVGQERATAADAAQKPATDTDTTTETDADAAVANPLAARLKRWFSRNSDDG